MAQTLTLALGPRAKPINIRPPLVGCEGLTVYLTCYTLRGEVWNPVGSGLGLVKAKATSHNHARQGTITMHLQGPGKHKSRRHKSRFFGQGKHRSGQDTSPGKTQDRVTQVRVTFVRVPTSELGAADKGMMVTILGLSLITRFHPSSGVLYPRSFSKELIMG